MKKLIVFATVMVMLGIQGCSIFKEKCDCPKFNQQIPTENNSDNWSVEDPCA